MIKSKYIKSGIIALFCTVILTGSNFCTDRVTAEPAVKQYTASTVQGEVKPLAVVNSPSLYLNKKITMNAKFDKFATLGLDYKAAFRSSEKYISFLIKRDDTQYNIPLSEMKLFLKRDLAEKFIDLKTNDEIRIDGTVFSDALGDAWVDVESITITKKAPENEKDGAKE
jgi:hypothetical protein